MATDTLLLGAVEFTDFSAPAEMPFGGRQAMAIHKLPGGKRVIDTLGPDDADYSWSGEFFSNDAYTKALTLDGMRRAGQPIPLIFGGQFYLVIISEFTPHIARYPVHVKYSITVVVAESPMSGALDAVMAGIDAMVSGDLAGAMAL
jgi:hypothetical protein